MEDQKPTKAGSKQEKARRLAAALKANLRRRKAQARERAQASEAEASAPGPARNAEKLND